MMKSTISFTFAFILFFTLASCRQQTAQAVPATNTAEISLTATPSHTLAPAQTVENTEAPPIQPFTDVRQKNLSDLKVKMNASLIQTLWFNQSTSWPVEYEALAQDILERGKNPGLGIRKLHKQGITGKGVTVAIIDQNMVLDHPEVEGKIVEYYDTGTSQPADEGSMHGPAVTSLLVGESIGIAPDAKVYYVAVPSWKGDAQYYADALAWIVEKNESLAEGDKIRIVSVSAAPSGVGSPFTMNNDAWDMAYQKATQAGMLVLDCTMHHGITAPCYYDLYDPDNVAKCTPGWPGFDSGKMPDRIYIPTSYRTTAEEYNQGVFAYQYTGRGGLSWSIPYLSGVLALGWQVRPDLTATQLVEMIFRSAYVTEDGLKVIYPEAFIEMVNLASSE